MVRRLLDPYLPRRETALDLLLLPRLLRRLTRPALLVAQPALDRDIRLDALVRELRFDDRAGTFRLGLGLGAAEAQAALAKDLEPAPLELARETLVLVRPE